MPRRKFTNENIGRESEERLGRVTGSLSQKEFARSEASPSLLERYKQERLALVKPATVNRELNTIKTLFTKAVQWGYLKDDPSKAVKKLQEKEKKLRLFFTGRIR